MSEPSLDKEDFRKQFLGEMKKIEQIHFKLSQKILRIREKKNSVEYFMDGESPLHEEISSYRQESRTSARGSPIPNNQPHNATKREESSTKNDL